VLPESLMSVDGSHPSVAGYADIAQSIIYLLIV